MKLSSSNGTQMTIYELEQSLKLLQNSFKRIQEINDGSYTNLNPAIQFDFCTCPQLSNLIDQIEMITKKISKVIYQG
ncbi:MAG: hypothetical protein RR415_10110 [Ruthenibacterium sp.]